MLRVLFAISSLSFLAFLVWLVGFVLHRSKNEEPGAAWCLVMMICCIVMTVSNALGLLSGDIIAGVLLLFTGYGTVQYYRMWQIRKQGW